MIIAISTQLSTGSITNNITIGQSQSRPDVPYNVVYAGDTDSGGVDEIGLLDIHINCHMKQGDFTEIMDYVNIELKTLLHDIRLTDHNGRKFILKATKKIGPIVPGNDDGSISMERIFRTVKYY